MSREIVRIDRTADEAQETLRTFAEGVSRLAERLGVDSHAVGFAPFQVGREFAPIVVAFVGVFPGANDGLFGTGFILGTKDLREGQGGGCGGRGE